MPTTSATTGGARFIGRVGALAVALGIGVAVANGTAIASAGTGSSKAGERRSSAVSTDRKSDKGAKDAKSAAGTVEAAVSTVRQAVSRAIDTATETPRKRPAALDTRTRAATEVDTTAPAQPLTTVTVLTKNVVDQALPASTASIRPPHVIPELVAEVTERLKPRIPQTPVNPLHDVGLAALLGRSTGMTRPTRAPTPPLPTPISVC